MPESVLTNRFKFDIEWSERKQSLYSDTLIRIQHLQQNNNKKCSYSYVQTDTGNQKMEKQKLIPNMLSLKTSKHSINNKG